MARVERRLHVPRSVLSADAAPAALPHSHHPHHHNRRYYLRNVQHTDSGPSATNCTTHSSSTRAIRSLLAGPSSQESLDRFQARKFSLLLYFTGSRGLGQKKNQHSVIRVSGSSCPFSGAKFLNTARTVHTPQRLPIDYDRPWWGECVKEESERGRRSNGVSPVPSLPLSLTQWVHEYWVSIPSTRVPSHRK